MFLVTLANGVEISRKELNENPPPGASTKAPKRTKLIVEGPEVVLVKPKPVPNRVTVVVEDSDERPPDQTRPAFQEVDEDSDDGSFLERGSSPLEIEDDSDPGLSGPAQGGAGGRALFRAKSLDEFEEGDISGEDDKDASDLEEHMLKLDWPDVVTARINRIYKPVKSHESEPDRTLEGYKFIKNEIEITWEQMLALADTGKFLSDSVVNYAIIYLLGKAHRMGMHVQQRHVGFVTDTFFFAALKEDMEQKRFNRPVFKNVKGRLQLIPRPVDFTQGKCRALTMPVHLDGHWISVIMHFDYKDRQIHVYYADSLGKRADPKILEVCEFYRMHRINPMFYQSKEIRHFFQKIHIMIPIQVKPQTGMNCGIHAAVNTVSFHLGMKLERVKFSATKLRKALFHKLYSKWQNPRRGEEPDPLSTY